MNAERWQQIEGIFQSALERESGARAAYLDGACGGDESLRREVESLLAAYEKTGSFMNVPAHEVAAQLLAADGSGLQEGRQDDSTKLLAAPGTEIIVDDHQTQDTKLVINRRRRIILVGLFFALRLIYVGVNGYLVISYFSTSSDPGWQVWTDGRVHIYSATSDADVSTLQDDDEILTLNDQEFRDMRQYYRTFRNSSPGTPYTVVIRRDGQTEKFTLRTAPYQLWLLISFILIMLIIPVIFLLTGLAVFLLKPNDKQALLLALMLGMFFGVLSPASLLMTDVPSWLAGVLAAGYLVGACLFPVILHLFLIFPERSRLLRRFPRFEYYQYLLFLLTAYPFVVILAFVLVIAPERFLDFHKELFLLFIVYMIVTSMYMLGGLLSLAVTYRKANELSRRKLRVVFVSTIIGFLPFPSVGAMYFIFKPSLTPLKFVISFAAYLALLLVPLSFAYAIVRHQVIPVSLIIRRGVQYLFAKNGLRIIFALPIIGLLVTIIANPNRTLPEILFQNSIYFYVLLIATSTLMFRRRLSEWVDRKFFREAYNQEQILRELIDDLKRLDSLPEMSKHVSQRVQQALHLEHMYLFHQEEERRDLLLGYSSGQSAHGLRIPAEFRLLRFMETQGHAVEFPLPPKNNLPFVERAWLAKLGTNLIVPVSSTNGRLAGLFLLGEKKSEIPYTATDRQLLEAVASQVAVVYENVRLTKRLTREQRIKREVLARIEKQDINLLRECPTCGACFDNSVEFCAKDQSELTLTLPVERVIEERYRLDQLVGRGGMGAVYEATDIRLHRKVALKILSGSLFGQSDALRRFEREAQSAARLTHPHIITVYDYGVLTTEGAYLVMELVRGETLGSILKREQRLAPVVAAEWLDQTLAAVGAAHQAGIIHRDLKPDNIFITHDEKRNQVVKVLDFGLAKVIQHDAAESNSPTAQMTTPGTVMGTFGYMSPEQLMGTTVDERSDLFSVGVIAVEALTGHRPFGGKSYHELLTSILHEPFHLRSRAPEAVALDEVIQKCLAKDLKDRFASAAEMQRALIPAISRCPAILLDTRVSAKRAVPS